MADNGDEETQITIQIKYSGENKHSLTLPLSTTIGSLKQTLSTSDYADIPVERQRLIYSGRVLKDDDTLDSCKVKDGNTVHLVKGAESNLRQNPAASSAVPSNIAAGTGAGNPLAQLTGARYAGFHGLPGRDAFGADGGMGAPPNPDQMLRMLEDPALAQQMNEAINNPAVLEMLRNTPMIRNNPMARAAIEDPELRRMMMSPGMIRMQLQMQRAMGQGGEAFPMPGETDTTESQHTRSGQPSGHPTSAPSPFGSSSGAREGAQGNRANPIAAFAQQAMHNPRMLQQLQQLQQMQQMQQMMGSSDRAPSPFGHAPADERPPEERYESQLRQLNDMGFFEFERNVQALRRSGGSVQGAVEYLLSEGQ
ncbi:hypothetical protein K470DRAFT_229163, partial [Piedraia hortae CBS 480.64]